MNLKTTLTPILSAVLFSLLIFPQSSKAQDTAGIDTVKHWNAGGTFNLNFSQVGLHNWAGGGQSSIAANGAVSLFLTYKKNKNNWDNSLDIGYGVLKQGEGDSEFRKSDDELNLLTKYTHDLSKNFNFSGFIDLKTAMTKGYSYSEDEDGNEQQTLIADFMSPGYLISSIGVDYSPTEKIAITLSPLTGKTTFMLNEELSAQGRYGVDSGARIRQELGSNLNIALKGDPWENVSYKTEANFFSAYKNPDEIDVNWNGQLILKVNEYLVTTITTTLVYDEDIDVEREDGTTGPSVQFKEVIAVGFNYEFK